MTQSVSIEVCARPIGKGSDKAILFCFVAFMHGAHTIAENFCVMASHGYYCDGHLFITTLFANPSIENNFTIFPV